MVRFWARAKTEEEAVWREPHRPHQQLGWFPNFLCSNYPSILVVSFSRWNWVCEKGAFGCLYCEQKIIWCCVWCRQFWKKSGRKGKKLRSKRYVWLSSSLFIKKCFDAVFWSGQFWCGQKKLKRKILRSQVRFPFLCLNLSKTMSLFWSGKFGVAKKTKKPRGAYSGYFYKLYWNFSAALLLLAGGLCHKKKERK